jgi:hypothetical protein
MSESVIDRMTRSIWKDWDAGGYPNGYDELRGQVRAALAAAEEAGWVLVPKEPTEEMGRAGKGSGGFMAPEAYRAMLEKAPKP